MNYKTQLTAWALEMVIKNKSDQPLSALIEQTEQLVDFAYSPAKDLDDHAKELFELVKRDEDPQQKINQLIQTLQYMEEQMQIDRKIAEPVAGAA